MKRLITLLALLAVGAGMPSQALARVMTITVTADNFYDLYVNGVLVGSLNYNDSTYGWEVPETWTVDVGTSETTIAVAGQNMGGGGMGLILKLSADDGVTDVTDASWRVSDAIPPGWEQQGFDDAAWATAFDQGPYDTIPWGIYGPPITEFAGTGARWIWRGTPPYQADYGYYDDGLFQYCNFRRVVPVANPTPAVQQSWGALKQRYR